MKIPIYTWSTMSPDDKRRIFTRSETNISQVTNVVTEIIEAVKNEGDTALRRFSKEFDHSEFDHLPLTVTPEEFALAEKELEPGVKSALDYAIENITTFHKSQVPKSMEMHEIRKGVWAGERARPIDSVGLYIPRGRGSFPSMLYMLAIPAILAQVPHIAVVTPPGPQGKVDPACLYAAKKIGIPTVYRVGGAHAIAALAYGTDSIPRVLKVIGPGSHFVTAAKRILSHLIEPGLPAGPSESILWTDGSGSARTIALDLLIEAEHGADSSAILVCEDEKFASEIADILPGLIQETPEPRKSFLLEVFSEQGYGGIILTNNEKESAEVINTYAPEHLSIQTKNPWDSVSLIRNAGEILLGPDLPFSAANYLTGANAVLPTGSYARTWSGVSVRDFIKYSSLVYSTNGGYNDFKDHVIALADYEGFPRHSAALKNRIKNP